MHRRQYDKRCTMSDNTRVMSASQQRYLHTEFIASEQNTYLLRMAISYSSSKTYTYTDYNYYDHSAGNFVLIFEADGKSCTR